MEHLIVVFMRNHQKYGTYWYMNSSRLGSNTADLAYHIPSSPFSS